MAMTKFLILAITVAAYSVHAAEHDQRVKKDILLGTIPSYAAYQQPAYYTQPYAAYSPFIDYNGYYPSAAKLTPAAATFLPPATVSAYSTNTVHPLPYAGYPYQYNGALPYVKPYVY